ncbi:MAG: phospholipid/cholesterol/gamma-HCH transport system ATP-binding protein [Gammaproteobacteria bacterium]|jgi:phospholipid/cholesterol/gamma-HCH transport system ATP-binding protein
MNSSETRKKVIEIKNLSTHYGGVIALDNINLSLYEREILVVMGHSGSGKSTLFKNILGLMKRSTGSIEVLGKETTNLDKKGLYKLRRNIGVAFQNGALFSSLSVGENVELPLHEHTNLDKSTIQIMTRMKLALMNLTDCEDLMPDQLSGGMLKRAGLARAVVMDPKLLFFDEPSAGLDPVTSAQLDNLILQLRDALNMSIVIITHELESAFHVADRITVLDRGKQIITGTKEEIRASEDERITNMLNRVPSKKEMDGDAYLKALTE